MSLLLNPEPDENSREALAFAMFVWALIVYAAAFVFLKCGYIFNHRNPNGEYGYCLAAFIFCPCFVAFGIAKILQFRDFRKDWPTRAVMSRRSA